MLQYPLGVANGALTRVLEDGDGERVVICIHGVGARADRWRRNLPGLADSGYRAVAVDLPGHGFASKGASHPYSVPFWAETVVGVLDALQVERAVICGTSLGGHIAAHLACTAPDRVQDIIMIGTLGIVPMGEKARHDLARSIAERSREGIKRKMSLVAHQHELVGEGWIEEEYRINNSPGAGEAFGKIASYIADRIDDDVVGARLNDAPAVIRRLLVWGSDDVLVPVSEGTRSQDILNDISLVLMRDCGHIPYYERPETFNQLLDDFLNDKLSTERTQEL